MQEAALDLNEWSHRDSALPCTHDHVADLPDEIPTEYVI